MIRLLPDSVWKLLQLLCNWVAGSHIPRLLPDFRVELLQLLCNWVARAIYRGCCPICARKLFQLKALNWL